MLIFRTSGETPCLKPETDGREAQNYSEDTRYGSGNGRDPIRNLDRVGRGMFLGFFEGLAVFAVGLGLWLYMRRWRWLGIGVDLGGLCWALYSLFWPLLSWGG